MADLSDQAYAHIHQMILTGSLVPGDVITESVIAEHLGMSRTPVGEAIRQLVREGLVDQIPRKGAILRSIGRTELIDLFDVRQAVEPFAAGKVAEIISAKQLQKLTALSTAMKKLTDKARGNDERTLTGESMHELFAADMTFHMLILQATGNPRMQQAVGETRTVFSVFRMQRPSLDLNVVESAHEDHDAVIDAFRGRQADRARGKMEAHIIQSRTYALQELDDEASRSRAQPTSENLPGTLPPELLEELQRIDQES